MKVVVPMTRANGAPSVLFLPSAGSTALSLVRLVRSLRSRHSFFALELTELPKGEEKRTIAGLADYFVEAVRGANIPGPYILGGHCWGGIIAFEIAARLEKMGEHVASLILVESLPPRRKAGENGVAEHDSCETRQAVSHLCAEIRKNLSALTADQAQRFEPLTWALVDMALEYRPTSKIQIPLLLIHTPTHPETVFHGWAETTTNEVKSRIIPGDTFSILNPPIVDTLSFLILLELNSIKNRPSP